ncbi:MAG: hypothetical protein H6765_10230 [Candidatus Peribacteria bacterium]|nr:MAG: hypothetical protein H6765_10230 [Candidatus Peribacteria bacterium]
MYIDDQTEVEGDTLTFNVTLSGSSAFVTTVDYITVDGTAISGSDYT